MNLFCLIPGFCIRVVDIRPPSNGGVVCVCVAICTHRPFTTLSLPFHCHPLSFHRPFHYPFTALFLRCPHSIAFVAVSRGGRQPSTEMAPSLDHRAGHHRQAQRKVEVRLPAAQTSAQVST